MNDERKPAPATGFSSTIGDVSDSQLAVGANIRQSQTYLKVASPPTAEELAQLAALFDSLRAEVQRQAPPEVRDEAVRQTDALQEATLGAKPNVSAMAAAKQWFLQHAPGLLGAVTSVVINPIVGTIVSAAGEAIASEYDRWFPEARPASPAQP
jgi:hypothetical protein